MCGLRQILILREKFNGVHSTIYHRILVVFLTTFLALYPLGADAVVSEKQENTYSPEWGRIESATTTQPDLERSDSVTQMTDIEKEILSIFPDAPIMIEVARCESGLDPNADRAGMNVDVGLFQINQVHIKRLNELGLDRRVLEDNLAFARILYNEQGLSPWAMSKHCWGKFL